MKCQVMDCQVHKILKAIRPPFTDSVTSVTSSVKGSAKSLLLMCVTYFLKISPKNVTMLEYNIVTEFHTGSVLRSQVMDYQTHAIQTAIRPLFTDPVWNGCVIP